MTLADRLLHGPTPQDNHAIRALTWSFAACPPVVQDAILDALEADLRGHPHRLLQPMSARGVLRQGAGRAVIDKHRLQRLFSVLAAAPLNNDGISALAMSVARRPEAPRALRRAQVDHFLLELSGHLIGAIEEQNFNVKFKNSYRPPQAYFVGAKSSHMHFLQLKRRLRQSYRQLWKMR